MNQITPFTDPDEVLRIIKPVTDTIQLGLSRFLPVTRSWFEANGVPVEKACHAMMTRVLLKRDLREKQITVADEEEGLGFRVHGLANCGLIVTSADYNLRILKSRDGELPPAQSTQRRDFYQENLFTLEADDPHPGDPIPPLNLVAAWETDQEHSLRSLSIACPCGESDDKKVVCRWMKTLDLKAQAESSVYVSESLPPEPVLDEITLRQAIEIEPESFERLDTKSGKSDNTA